MQTNKSDKAFGKGNFRNAVGSLYPVARGSLALVHKPCANPNCPACKSGEKHPSWIFMHVQPRHVEILREAIENGRKLEQMILEEGLALIRRLRQEP